MKKMLFSLLMFLVLVPLVTAQLIDDETKTTLSELFAAVSDIFILWFIDTAAKLEAILRLAVFVVIFQILHSVFKHTLGRTPAGGTGPILEQKALNVLSVVITLVVSIFLPLPLLLKGSVILLLTLGGAVLIGIYHAFKIGTAHLSQSQAAAARVGLLIFILWIVGLLGNIGEELQVGQVKLADLGEAEQTLEAIADFQKWLKITLFVMIGINLVAFFIYTVPHAASTVGSALPPTTVTTGGRRGPRAWFPTLLGSPQEKARQLIDELQSLWILIPQNVTRKDATQLNTNKDRVQKILNQLFAYDTDALNRIATAGSLAGFSAQQQTRLRTQLRQEKNVLNVLYRLDIPTKIEQYVAAIGTPNEAAREAEVLDAIRRSRNVLDLLRQLNQQATTAAAAPAGTPPVPTGGRSRP